MTSPIPVPSPKPYNAPPAALLAAPRTPAYPVVMPRVDPARAERLKAALRANLRRRKAQDLGHPDDREPATPPHAEPDPPEQD